MFKDYRTDNDIDIHLCSNDKFKTNLIQLFLIQPLTTELQATRTALISEILRQGSRNYPTQRAINRRLQDLYGANLNSSVVKRGENQLVRLSLEIVNQEYVKQEIDLLKQGLELLAEIAFNPYVSENTFDKNHLKLARHSLREKIRGLINNKYIYASERCYQVMCSREPFGIYKLGSVESLEQIKPGSLYQHYQQLIYNKPLAVYIVGNIDQQQVVRQIENIIDFSRRQQDKLNNTRIKTEAGELREHFEEAPVNQGKLSLGFRTGITRNNPQYYALILYNGLLGGFPHSKLFQNVREKASLAYYANSRLESTKGLLQINAGIEEENFLRVREIILQQIEDLNQGNFSDRELEWTRNGVINHLQTASDNHYSLIGHYLLGQINNLPESLEDMMARIRQVSGQDLQQVGKNLKFDTCYFLGNKGGDNHGGNL